MFLNSPRTKFLITGLPGVGKTTLTEFLYNFLKNHKIPFNFYGFITQEIRKKEKRQGFKIKLLDSKKEYLLAKKKNLLNPSEFKNKPCVGKYVVFLNDLENIISDFFEKLKDPKSFFIIDEIGKMEAFSNKFCKFIESLLNSQNYLIATVGLADHPFLKKVRNYEPVFLCKLTKENRNLLKERLKLEFVRKGKLIVIEGIDGAGKTTFSKALAKILKEKGIDCILSAEPTFGPYGKKLRELLKNGNISVSEINEYFLKDRKWHVENILIPALNKGKWIILDRYYLSTIAYQGAQGLSLKDLIIENETIAPLPDLIVFLDLPLDLAFERINNRKEELSIFERKEFLEKVSKIYKAYLPWFSHVVLKAELSIEENLNKLLSYLDSKFKGSFS